MRVFQHHVLPSLVWLAALEAAAFFCAPLVASALLPVGLTSPLDVLMDMAVFGGTIFLGFTAMGLYSRRQRARLSGVLVRAVAAILAGVAAVAVWSYVVPTLSLPRPALGLSALIAIVVVALGRVGFDRLVDEKTFKRRVLIYGTGRRALGVSELRRRTDQRGFHVVAFVRTAEEERIAVPIDAALVLQLPLLEFCRQREVDEVVVAMEDRRRAFPVHELLECRLNGVQVIDIVDFLERETGRVRLDVLNPSWIIFSPGFDRSRGRMMSKRAFDVVASIGLLAIAWPFMLLAVLAIKIEDGVRSPVFYRQTPCRPGWQPV